MKDGHALLVALALFSIAASAANFAGEYSDKNYLNGQAVFQLSLEQTGNSITVFFSAGYKDGHGAGPEADGHGKVTAKGSVDFTWEDGNKNAGTGTITGSGDGVVLSLKTTRVSDTRCLVFYRQNIRLPKLKK